jgi:nuclear pore complex protein Nup107
MVSPSERHLYAALTSDLPTLIPACSTWEDHLWAHLQSRVETRLDSRWRELGGFWQEDSRTRDQILDESGNMDDIRVGGGLDAVFGEISAVQNEMVA